MSGNKNVYGLQSFTDASEAWKVMSSDIGSYEIDLQILNDNTFVKAVMEQIIIRVVDYKTGRISREELEISLGVNNEAMDTYMSTSISSCTAKKIRSSILQLLKPRMLVVLVPYRKMKKRCLMNCTLLFILMT